jgi:hypothetical protein
VRILSYERFSADYLLSQIRTTRLRGYDGAQPYINASLQLSHAVDADSLTPAQRYVLKPSVDKVIELRDALLEHDVDLFALDGGLYVVTSEHPDEKIPVIPPVVEASSEPDNRTVQLINDGMHRIFAARTLGKPISVITARNVPAQYPYYAYALEGGWSQVSELTELPDTFQKKNYRQPQNYKSLFRDFNAVFPGVQKQRKQSNPSHITW